MTDLVCCLLVAWKVDEIVVVFVILSFVPVHNISISFIFDLPVVYFVVL